MRATNFFHKMIMVANRKQLIEPSVLSAFTLSELLVVITIIAILAALLLPALGRVRDRGYQVRCFNNQHTLYVAETLYARDNNDNIPTFEGLDVCPFNSGCQGNLAKSWMGNWYGRIIAPPSNSIVGGVSMNNVWVDSDTNHLTYSGCYISYTSALKVFSDWPLGFTKDLSGGKNLSPDYQTFNYDDLRYGQNGGLTSAHNNPNYEAVVHLGLSVANPYFPLKFSQVPNPSTVVMLGDNFGYRLTGIPPSSIGVLTYPHCGAQNAVITFVDGHTTAMTSNQIVAANVAATITTTTQ